MFISEQASIIIYILGTISTAVTCVLLNRSVFYNSFLGSIPVMLILLLSSLSWLGLIVPILAILVLVLDAIKSLSSIGKLIKYLEGEK